MKVALVHDWLTGMRGGERCLEIFLKLYPQADIFTLFHVPGSTSPQIDAQVKETSVLNKLPGVRRYYRALLPLYPLAAKSLKLRGYDLVISLSHAAAKNVDVGSEGFHICYCLTPMRYIWDQAPTYFGKFLPAAWPLIKVLRSWDLKGADNVDSYVAISRFIAARIRCFYNSPAKVIYPPVNTSWITPAAEGSKGEAFLYAGALVPYKRAELVVQAFNQLGEPLWIVGKGPLEKQLRRMAAPNVRFFGYVPDSQLADFYRRSRALVFPAKEDFGLIPIECLAAGRPVIALYHGATKESLHALKPWRKQFGQEDYGWSGGWGGVFIQKRRNADEKAEISALVDSVRFFIDHEDRFSATVCRNLAETFSVARFVSSWQNLMEDLGLESKSGTVVNA